MVRAKTVAALALGAAAGAGVVYMVFLVPDPPREAIHDRVENLAAVAGALPGGDSASWESLDGRWEIAPGSQVGYRVREQVINLPLPRDAVGRTEAVTGGLTVSREGQDYSVNDIAVEADLTKLRSDSSRRDETLRTKGLETDRYPTATFTARPVRVPAETASSGEVRLTLEGMLTVHDVTKQVSIPAEAHFNGDRAQVSGSVTFPMAEFGIEPPDVANIVTIEPTCTMEFNLLFRKAS